MTEVNRAEVLDAPKILVVDDAAANLVAIRSALQSLGNQIVEADSGREALRVLLEQDFSLILLDVNMPELDGYETARLIRSRNRSRGTPIIFVTAHDRNDEAVLEGYALGAVDYLFKPIVPDVLRAKAAVFVELHRRTVEARKQAETIRELERAAAERRLLSERRKWEARQLREENRRKDEFLAVLAHELRNPLAPIRLGLRLLEADGVDAERRGRVMASMRRQVTHLVRLVDDLLDVARISRGKIVLQLARRELSALISQALDTQRAHINDRRQALEVVCAPDLWVEADEVRLCQIVQNLISNASRYTPPEGHIRCETFAEGQQVVIRVSDDGQGIDPARLQEVFGLFVQEREGLAGLGLGLSLVQHLTELHGGTVEARSEGPGTGSTFEVRLRRSGPPVELSIEAPAPAPVPAGVLKVLVIEDNADVREATAALLELNGHHVLRAPSGRAGLALVESERPQVAVVDLSMPDMTGIEVAREIIARFGEDRPRLIALTGHGDPETRRQLAECGFDSHLLKPAEPEALERTLWS